VLSVIQLLSACVKNCGHIFHLEIASRDFINECKSLIGEKVSRDCKRVSGDFEKVSRDFEKISRDCEWCVENLKRSETL